MKKILFTIAACIVIFSAKAQIGYNYSQYDFGAFGAINTAHTDFSHSNKKYAAQLQFTYNYSPFINYIAEVQAGTLSGDELTLTPGGYKYNNDYISVAFRAQLQMGEIMDYSRSRFNNFFKNIYVSAGIGVVYTNLTVISDDPASIDPDATILTELPTNSKSSNAFIPLKAGYEFKLFNSYSEPWAKIDFGYQYNYVLSDNLDGVSYGNKKDAWSQIVVGVKFALGGVTSYRKSISY